MLHDSATARLACRKRQRGFASNFVDIAAVLAARFMVSFGRRWDVASIDSAPSNVFRKLLEDKERSLTAARASRGS